MAGVSVGALDRALNNQGRAAILQQPGQQGYRAIMVLFNYFTANVIPSELTTVESYILFKESIEELPN
jgi:hypothetical protein